MHGSAGRILYAISGLAVACKVMFLGSEVDIDGRARGARGYENREITCNDYVELDEIYSDRPFKEKNHHIHPT